MGQDVVIVGRNELPKNGSNYAYSKASVSSKGRVQVDTYHQDQTTRPIAISAYQTLDDTITLSATPTVDSYTIELTAGHGVVNDDYLQILEQNGEPRLFTAKALNVATNTVTLDSPVPFAFLPAAASIIKYNPNLNLDGSVTKIVTGWTNPYDVGIDITLLIFHIEDNVAMDTGKFGGITALTRGIVLRKNNNDGTYVNYWNIKKNGGFSAIAYELEYDTKAPAGLYAIRCRLSYGGQDQYGVVIRLDPGQSIELLIQDDLTDLSEFDATIEGHIIEV